MVQEAYMRAFRFFDGFHGSDSRAWLLTIVRNTCYTWLRQQRLFDHNMPYDEELHDDGSEMLNPERLVMLNADNALLKAALEERIRASVHKASRPERDPFAGPRLPWRLFALAAAVAAVVIGAVGIVALMRGTPGAGANQGLAQEVVASHIRSLMGNHLEDVASTDQHTVKPWFDGKLDFSPVVNDFSAQGFPLVGGRLDYLDNRPVAALVYGRHKHYINLFVWPVSGGSDAGVQTTEAQGYQVFHWTTAGMTYWAVSDVNGADLGQFVQLVQGGAEPTVVP